MTVVSVLLVLSVVLLAYMNGANDNFKGVATLFGSETSSYRKALIWATVTTLTGSLLALVLAQELVQTFQGKDLVPERVTTDSSFLLAVSLGTALTVMIATWLALPVATTHALTGGLIGAGLVAAAGEVRLDTLVSVFVLPLLLSPLAACFLTALAYAVVRHPLSFRNGGDNQSSKLLDALHYLSGGAVGFARGVNATPKILALLLAGQTLDSGIGLVLVAAAMALGSLSAWPVAETMSRRITRMSAKEGLTANLITAILVIAASRFGLPVATTQVAVGSLCGIGMSNGTATLRPIARICLAWITTLPLAGVLAAGLYWILQSIAWK